MREENKEHATKRRKEYEVNRGEKGTRKKRNQTEEKKDGENERKREQSILHPIKSNSPR